MEADGMATWKTIVLYKQAVFPFRVSESEGHRRNDLLTHNKL